MRKKFMRLKKLVPIVGFCTVSVLSSSAMAQLWVKNCAVDKCLDAMTVDTNGKVQVSDCTTSKKAQQWYVNGILPSPIRNAHFERQCLGMQEVVVGGFEVVINDCKDESKARKWNFALNGHQAPIENDYFSGQCLTVANDGTVTPMGCNGDLSQRWYWLNVGDNNPCPADAVIKLRIGQTAELPNEDIRIKFTRVDEDSRCPKDVQCVWEGQVTVVLQFVLGEQKPVEFRLTLRGGLPDAKVIGEYQVKLLKVAPDRMHNYPPTQLEYQITLNVSKQL
jgi:hypothetical protein